MFSIKFFFFVATELSLELTPFLHDTLFATKLNNLHIQKLEIINKNTSFIMFFNIFLYFFYKNRHVKHHNLS